jgi:hypothetical protein
MPPETLTEFPAASVAGDKKLLVPERAASTWWAFAGSETDGYVSVKIPLDTSLTRPGFKLAPV